MGCDRAPMPPVPLVAIEPTLRWRAATSRAATRPVTPRQRSASLLPRRRSLQELPGEPGDSCIACIDVRLSTQDDPHVAAWAWSGTTGRCRHDHNRHDSFSGCATLWTRRHQERSADEVLLHMFRVDALRPVK